MKDIVDYSRRVRLLVLLVAVLSLSCWLLISISLTTDVGPLLGQGSVVWLVPALWIPWLLLQWNHYRLISFGRVATRYPRAPNFVNRPDLVARLLMHLSVNWMVLATSVGLAWLLTGTKEGRVLSGLIIVASVLTWFWFNWQHRRVNRPRNLALSTTMAVAVIAAATLVLRT